MELLEREAPRIGTVARQVGCSVRTLQARLRKEGTTYEKLLDEARRQMAIQYVEDDSIRLMEIPLLLQFAEPSPFHRAFRRWTGTTPLEYRRRRLSRGQPLAVRA
jgi:AraC-like DNA-binding protein